MTVITGRQFRANQSKYIGMAQRGERVIENSPEFLVIAEKVRQEYEEGKGVTLRTHEEIENYLNSL